MNERKVPPCPDSVVDRFRVSGLTKAEWILLALESLDQADVSVAQFARAANWARANWEKTIDELTEEGDR
jgi:hypothetical protein